MHRCLTGQGTHHHSIEGTRFGELWSEKSHSGPSKLVLPDVCIKGSQTVPAGHSSLIQGEDLIAVRHCPVRKMGDRTRNPSIRMCTQDPGRGSEGSESAIKNTIESRQRQSRH